jgi:ABC-type glycerol-3-phosphate transport system permease component
MSYGLGFGDLLILMVPLIIVLIPAWRILRRAGFSGAWALLLVIPLVNLVAVYVFAFTDWPVERRARTGA